MPYRIVMSGIPTAAGNTNTVTIEWDTTQGGKHALDYLTTYNRSVTQADAATGAPNSLSAIPGDPFITFGANQPMQMLPARSQQLGQVFAMWGGTIPTFPLIL